MQSHSQANFFNHPLLRKLPPLAIISTLNLPPCNHFWPCPANPPPAIISRHSPKPPISARECGFGWPCIEAMCGVFRAYWVEDSETAPTQSFPNSPHLLPPPIPPFSVRERGFGRIPSFSIFRNIKRNDCTLPPSRNRFPSPRTSTPSHGSPSLRPEVRDLCCLRK